MNLKVITSGGSKIFPGGHQPIITARKRSLGQGNIFTSVCQEFHPHGGSACSQGVWFRAEGGASSGGSGPGGVSRPTPKGEVEGDQVQAHTRGGNWGGSGPDPHPRGKLRGIRSRPTPKGEIEGDQVQAPHPTPDGYCCGRYASYWNAFLFGIIFAENCMKIKNIGLRGPLPPIPPPISATDDMRVLNTYEGNCMKFRFEIWNSWAFCLGGALPSRITTVVCFLFILIWKGHKEECFVECLETCVKSYVFLHIPYWCCRSMWHTISRPRFIFAQTTNSKYNSVNVLVGSFCKQCFDRSQWRVWPEIASFRVPPSSETWSAQVCVGCDFPLFPSTRKGFFTQNERDCKNAVEENVFWTHLVSPFTLQYSQYVSNELVPS